MIVKDKVFDVLFNVERPGRYTGNEINMVVKDKDKVDVRFAFCFPDLYEIGMSHLGLKILYHMLNEREDIYCERVFLPWFDMQEIMKKNQIPIFSLETYSTIDEFDIIGFTLQYEMSYTNLLKVLELGNIPLRSSQRDENYPIVIAGGPCSFNPEPLSSFIDLFVLGEGEEVTLELIDLYKDYKQKKYKKEEFLIKASQIEGIYVPSLYDVLYTKEGTIKSITPKYSGIPKIVKKRIIKNLENVYFPQKMITPIIEVVHDRVTLEIFRGCARGCRFCQAGYIYRPVRFKNKESLKATTINLIKTSGSNEVSLSSLSTSDYPDVELLARDILREIEHKKVNLSLPSLRLDSTTLELLREIDKVRKPTLTFAPEAGTQRLRDVINKNITEDNIFSTIQTAFEMGFGNVKLYFMLGLPTETDDDILGIYDIAKRIKDIYTKTAKRFRLSLGISTSFFVPKAHTPFQWEGQITIEEMQRKARFLKEKLKKIKGVDYSYHDYYLSKMEAVFSRGDRRLDVVLENALKLGCQFDNWSDYFDFSKWEEAFKNAGVDYSFYSDRIRDHDEILPWDIIDSGVDKEFLIKEHKKSKEAKTTPSCFDKCSLCGATTFKGGICFAKV
ncbi:TIGR03960 family B12-binding radical SAM protein [Caldicellulosiruptoraceae bacterium PP1]